MRCKEGVTLFGMRPEIICAMYIANSVRSETAPEMVITSVTDGWHSYGSLHYSGAAFDLRIRDVRDPLAWAHRIKEALTAEFDVVLEDDHIHVEFQPKGPGRRPGQDN